jgi:CubicO group peptidase (beta-lactamase class C family)
MRPFVHRFIVMIALAAGLVAGPVGAAPAGAAPATHPRLDEVLADVRGAGRIPGATAVGFRDGRFQVAVDGQRRASEPTRIRFDDRLHIGSNLKSMTASLVAFLVERRRLRWESTLAELLPDVPMQPAYRDVTVEQVLQHRGGVVSLQTLDEIAMLPVFEGTPAAQRAAFAAWALAREPETEVGRFGYSNGGYGVVGAIVDRVAGMPYEQAMQRHLFRPLGIDAVFGWPASADPRAPWGHFDDAGVVVETDPGDVRYQFPAWLRSAGDASMNAADYATYLRWHAEGLCGRPALLRASSFARMHRVPESEDGEPYSMGWSEIATGDGRIVSVHSGSAGNFYTTGAIDNRCRKGIGILGNSGSDDAATATEAAVLEWMR